MDYVRDHWVWILVGVVSVVLFAIIAIAGERRDSADIGNVYEQTTPDMVSTDPLYPAVQ